MAKAQTMPIYAKCLPDVWDKFYMTASHLQNKTTTCSLEGTTPWEQWYEQKPDYSYMWEISCKVFILIQNKHNPKIYERSIECVLIGYDNSSKKYRCYHRETKRVFSSYHVQFLESCDGHSPTLPEVPTEATTLESIIKSATPTLIFFNKDEEELLPPINPLLNLPNADPIPWADSPDIIPKAIDIPQNVPTLPEETISHRSSRIAEKPPTSGPSQLERAVQESTDAAVRLKATWAEWKKTLQDIQEEEKRNAPQVVKDAAIKELCQAFGTLNLREGKAEQIDQVLFAIFEMTKIDPSTLEFEDEP